MEQVNFAKDKTHKLFIATVILKGLFGLIETLSSILFFITGAASGLIIFLVARELGEDPNDFIANKIINFLPYLALHSQLFIAWYLLIHGFIKVALVTALLRKKLWAYPASLFALAIFILYQLYQISRTNSVFLILLTLFDVFVIYLIWREYKFLKLSISLPN